MSESIRLHPKHGLNPTIPICYWCGKDKGEVALLGAAYKGEAPRSMVIDHEPCDKCKKLLKRGIMFVSVRDGESGPNPYRTGKMCVIKERAVRRLWQPGLDEDVFRKRICFIEDRAWKALGLPTEDVG